MGGSPHKTKMRYNVLRRLRPAPQTHKLNSQKAVDTGATRPRAHARALVSLFALATLITLSHPAVTFATPDPTLVGGSATTGYSGTAMPITDLQVSGTGNPTVPVKLRVASGSLAMTTTTGLTFTGSSTGSTLQFSGTLSNVNTALATLQYTRTGTGTDTLEVSLVNAGEVFFPDNNHLYEYVSYTATWQNAKTNAESRTKYGASGYLTTITSQAENDFVAARLLNAGWMGASDSVSEGDWKWVVGPETGTSFWSGLSTGSAVAGRYSNWGSGEPNNAGDEDCAQFLTGGTGKWNDLPCTVTTLPGYVVEYGTDSAPLDIASKNVSITTQAANQYPSTPTSLGPTSSTNASWSNSTTPSFNFTLSDPDAGNTLKYRIQVDNNMDFSSPTVDYTSVLAAQGARSFTVGQAAGSGSYTVGSNGQTLSDAQYYWRVKAIDNNTAESSFVAANSGNIAFRIDTGTPGKPPTPTTTTPTVDTTPTWTLGSVTDSMSGFGTRSLEWSLSPTFASGVFTGSADWPAFNTFTHITPLSDGTWYFRVRATDAAGNVSSYSNSATVVVDTTAPTAPSTPVTTNPTSDTTPTWTWTASTDVGAGLSQSQSYFFEFSTDPGFSSYTSYNSLTTNSFTHDTPLSDGTWYARVIAMDALGHSTSPTALGSVVIDTVAPAITNPSSSAPTSTSAAVQWTTDSLADARILYGPSASYGSQSSLTDTTPRTTSHSISLTGLLPCTTYHYQVVSTDASSNQTTGPDASFTTAGCAGSASVLSQAAVAAPHANAANLDLLNSGVGVSVSKPAGTTADDATLQIKHIDSTAALSSIGTPSGLTKAGDYVYDIKLLKDATTPLTSFAQPITITFTYADADSMGLAESSLRIVRWDDGSGWQTLDGCVVDTGNNTVTCTTTGFSTFALFGTKTVATKAAAASVSVPEIVAALAPTLSTSSNSTSSSNGGDNTVHFETSAKATSTGNVSSSSYWYIALGASLVLIFWFIIALSRKKKDEEQKTA